MSNLWYKLKEDKTVEPLPDGVYPQRDENFRVGDDTINEQRVSTVFLSLDHSWIGGPPLLFETMIFDGPYDGFMRRYSTYDEALAGHNKVVEVLKLNLNPEIVIP